MSTLDGFRKSVKLSHPVWALVLRGQTIKLVPGKQAKETELLAWTVEGAKSWARVANVETRLIGT